MTQTTPAARPLTVADIRASVVLGLRDFRAAPGVSWAFAAVFVAAGIFMALVTILTGQTFWLILAVLGFPLLGTLAAVGFYEISRLHAAGTQPGFGQVLALVWAHRKGQLPWLATIIIVIFLAWFFLGHMIFALFLGLSPMTNVSTSFEVFLTIQGRAMMVVGTCVGAAFAALVFAISVLGMPMLVDRDIDFMTALLRSVSAVAGNPLLYLAWGAVIAVVTLISMLPAFLGLFITIPVLGHTSWHLYKRVTRVSAA